MKTYSDPAPSYHFRPTNSAEEPFFPLVNRRLDEPMFRPAFRGYSSWFLYTKTSRPRRSITDSRRKAAPLGFLSPFSHFCTVETLAFR